MNQPNWAIVLHYIHDHEGVLEIKLPDENLSESHPVVENTELSPSEAEYAINYLIHTGLLEEEGQSRYSISKRGFDTVHQRQMEARNWDAAYASLFLTLGLVTATLIGVMIRGLEGIWLLVGLVGLTVVFVPGTLYLNKQITVEELFGR